MGCCASQPLTLPEMQHETVERVIAVPDSSAPPLQVDVREATSMLDVSISQGFLHGGGSINATMSEDSAIYKYVVNAQIREGLRVLTSFPQIEVPTMPSFGTGVAMAMGQAASLEMKQTSILVLTPIPPGLTISTKCAYVPFHVNASLGFNNVKIEHVQDGVTGCIAHEATQGFRCVGIGLLNSTTAVEGGVGGNGVSSAMLAELVFQKVHNPVVTSMGGGMLQVTEMFETIAFQNAVTTKVATAFGGMETDVPDLLPTLNLHGSQGWELDGFIMMQSSGANPMASIMSGGMQPGMGMGGGQATTTPFQMFLSRVPHMARPVHYVVVRHECTLNMVSMMMGSGTPQVENHPKPLIAEYAARGWVLKGALNLPPEMRPGQVAIRIPVLLYFMSNTAAIPWAVPMGAELPEAVPMAVPEAVPVEVDA
jgi:hypothetical protein